MLFIVIQVICIDTCSIIDGVQQTKKRQMSEQGVLDSRILPTTI